jgi:hypothetical protein
MTLVGWDWASRTHDVTVLDDDGGVRERWSLHLRHAWAVVGTPMVKASSGRYL